jgi:pyruvate,orthophosphate dikinase
MARYVALILPGAAREGEAPAPRSSPSIPTEAPLVPAGCASGEARLGGKGAGLVRMAGLGLPVPPGVVITTELWQRLHGAAAAPPDAEDTEDTENTGLWAQVWSEVDAALRQIEAATGTRLGDAERPLLLAVRSGAAVSLPGMMDSVCNLGLNDATVEGLAARLGDRRCALDCYRRFLHCYGTVVLGLRPTGLYETDPLDALLFEHKQRRGVLGDSDFTLDDLATLCAAYKSELRRRRGEGAVPEDPGQQLRAAVQAVLRSWNNPRAREYRRLHGISEQLGTAVVIQAMVFGNLDGGGAGSAAGVAFTRDPSTGEPTLYGEYLPAAQGEDIVSGGHTPRPLGELAASMPAAYADLERAARTLETHLGDMQDIEFTIERGRLWLLQTRSGKRSGRAMLKIACDLQREGRLPVDEVLRRVDAARLGELLRPTLDRQAPRTLLGRGLPASPGAASGPLVFSSEAAAELRQRGEAAILARIETSSDDIVGIQAAAGVITVRGGMTSHAAVVARGMGRSAVVGVSTLQVDYAQKELRTHEHVVRSGEILTIDGTSGEVLLGAVPLRAAHLADNPDYTQLLRWADERATVRVLAEADTAAQAQLCRDLGLHGIGLSRSERLLCAPARFVALREVCARPADAAARARLTASLLAGYRQLLTAAPGEVMVRLFDPAATAALLSAADCELMASERGLLTAALTAPAPSEDAAIAQRLAAIWQAQLAAIAAAHAAQPAAARPVALLPDGVSPTQAAALDWPAEVAMGALVKSPAAAPDLLEQFAPLAVLGFASGGEPDAAQVRSLRAAASGRTLRLGLYTPPTGETDKSEPVVAVAVRLGLDFVVYPLLRAPIARLLAGQLGLSERAPSS